MDIKKLLGVIIGLLTIVVTLAISPSIGTANAVVAAANLTNLIGMSVVVTFGAPLCIFGLLALGGVFTVGAWKGTTSMREMLTVIITAVICGLITNHIEKDAVEMITIRCLVQDFEQTLLLITGIDTGMHLAVIVHAFSCYGADIEPLRVINGNGFIELAEIKSTNDTNAILMQTFNDLSDHVNFQVWIHILKRQLRGIIGNYAANINKHNVGAYIECILYISVDIKIDNVNFPQVCLH